MKRSVLCSSKSHALVVVVEDGVVNAHEDVTKNARNTFLVHHLNS